MVDNTIALQVRPFQMPDVGQIYGNVQNIQMNRMRMAEAQEGAQERNALRSLLSSGVDPYSPEGLAQVRRVAPMLAAPFAQAAGQQAYQRAQIDRIRSQNDRDAFQTAQTLLVGVRNADDYAALRPALVERFPQYAQFFRPEYSPELIQRLALGAEGLIRRESEAAAAARPDIVMVDGMPFVRTREGDNIRLRPVLEGEPPAAPTVPAAPAAAPPAAPPAAPTATPTAAPAAERVPTSRSTDLLAIDSSIRRAEGTGQNPRSSARGPYQFLDSTFVEQFRRAFPDAAQGRSDAEVLRFRNARLADGRQVEDVLGPAFTQQNVQALSRANIEPSGTNVYLAHHFGADGAIRMLNADRGTPIDRLVSRQVLEANPFLRGLTVNQVLSWAGNAMDYGPGEARRLLDASRAPAREPGEAPAPAVAAPAAAAPAARPNAMVTPASAPAPANAFVAASATAPGAPAPMFPQSITQAREQKFEREEEVAFRRERGQLRARSAADARSDLTATTEALNIINSIMAPRPDLPDRGSLLQTATGSFVGAGLDLAGRAVGMSRAAGTAAAELETQHAALVSLLPRMRGDLNKAEFDSLQAQAAKIGDRTQTYESRLAAANTLRERLVRVQQRLARETDTELPPTLETLRPAPPSRPRPNPRGETPRTAPAQRLRFNPETGGLDPVE